MNGKERILRENLLEYESAAGEARASRRSNTAVTLFFKAICAAVDLFILHSEGVVPSSHTHRFRIIQEKYPALYDIIDRDFPFYQDSYTKKSGEDAVEVLAYDLARIKKMLEK